MADGGRGALQIAEATEVTDELVGAFARLVPQLSRSSAPPGSQELEELVRSPSTLVLVARLAVELRLESLWRRKISVGDVEVLRPAVHVRIEADGTSNVPAPKAGAPAD